jgi:ribonuclease-3
MNETEDNLVTLEERIGYTFVDKALLKRALTAPSYRATHGLCLHSDNQRFEFLGDAVLGLLAAEHVYQKYDQHAEGMLTIQRSHLASGRALAISARAIGLGSYMRIGLSDETTGGTDKEKLLADGMEAIFGAAWCDGGLPAVSQIFRTILERHLDDTPANHWENNPKGYLQAICQHRAWTASPVYQTTDTTGPDHEPFYTVRVSVEGGYEATGTGRSKRTAEADAARHLLGILSMHNID